VLLSVANGNFQRQPLADTIGLLLAFAAFMVVGAMIVAHRPGNAIGWIFAAIGLLAVTGALAQEYAASARHPARPAARPDPGRLVRRLGLVPHGRPGGGVHPAAVPRRPARRRPAGGWSAGWPGRERRRWSPRPPSRRPSSWTTGGRSTTRSGSPGSVTPRRGRSAWSSPMRSSC
jgi:hypothetical protein